jgi:hypothetical protein
MTDKKQPEIKILTRDEIAELDDLPTEILVIPEWGENVGVVIRGCSADERVKFVDESTDPETDKIDTEKAVYSSILLGVIQPKFTEDDIPMLKARSASAIDRISRKWLELSGIGEDQLRDARKNS